MSDRCPRCGGLLLGSRGTHVCPRLVLTKHGTRPPRKPEPRPAREAVSGKTVAKTVSSRTVANLHAARARGQAFASSGDGPRPLGIGEGVAPLDLWDSPGDGTGPGGGKWWPFGGSPPKAPSERGALESLLSISRTQWQPQQPTSLWRKTALPHGYRANRAPPVGPEGGSNGDRRAGTDAVATQGRLRRLLPYFQVLWEQHENRVQQFQNAPPKCISYTSVPWPDVDRPNDLLQLRLAGGPGGDLEVQSILRPLTLQWHPDKFQQRFGGALRPDDRDRIMNRVTAIFQLLVAAKNVPHG